MDFVRRRHAKRCYCGRHLVQRVWHK
jgi:hypothetical protein